MIILPSSFSQFFYLLSVLLLILPSSYSPSYSSIFLLILPSSFFQFFYLLSILLLILPSSYSPSYSSSYPSFFLFTFLFFILFFHLPYSNFSIYYPYLKTEYLGYPLDRSLHQSAASPLLSHSLPQQLIAKSTMTPLIYTDKEFQQSTVEDLGSSPSMSRTQNLFRFSRKV